MVQSKLHFNSDQKQLLLIVLFLFIGSCLRLIWPEDMEWKSEEVWMFEQAHRIATGEIPLPLSGIMSSIGIPNPGLGLWCFSAIALLTDDPVAMVRGVQWINVVTLWLLFSFVLTQVKPEERYVWLWGIAIASVNPLAILFSRKIWIPDLLAPFCFLILWGHWFRHRFWGSFVWGMATILSGQIHMGGFFFTLGYSLWSIVHDYQRKILKKFVWQGYALGLILGGIPFVLWLQEALPQWQRSSSSIVGVLFPKFYTEWLITALGINLGYSLKKYFWVEFLKEPLIFGIPTYLMVIAHLFLVGVGIYPLYRWFKHRKKKQNSAKASQLVFYLKATGFGVGGTFTLSGTNFVPYYLPIVFPFPYLWLSWLYSHQKQMILAIIMVQLLISLTFLTYIHRTGGADYGDSDYGRTYRFQQLHNSQNRSLLEFSHF